MAYLLTGATGFIGANLVPLLLGRAGNRRDGATTLHLLVRESSLPGLDARVEQWTAGLAPAARQLIEPVVGDLHEPLLGLGEATVARLRAAGIEHFFHLAAVYDMAAGAELNQLANVEGTHHALELASAVGADVFHHVSSIAVAGGYRGSFSEEMFDVGQPLDHPYHRTKFDAERLVRDSARVPWRIYRPAIVVGDSRSGAAEKIDGPYYFLPLIKRAGQLLPQTLPLVAPELGHTNLVPVDYVAAALDHIAHAPGLDGQTFHLADPTGMPVIDAINTFAALAGAPGTAIAIDPGPLARPARTLAGGLLALRPTRAELRELLARAGIPEEVAEHISLPARFETVNARAALAGSGIEPPPLAGYADRLWQYWLAHLDPNLHGPRSIAAAVAGRTIMITGASSGIGRATALLLARHGATVLIVARGAERLEQTRAEIAAAGGAAHAYTADLSDPASVQALVARVQAEHHDIDVLINSAGRSIRRSVALSYDRFHDYERMVALNYLGTIRLIMGLLPRMRERHSGHVINVSSIGVQTNPPRFSAYVASKAALDAWTRVVSSECLAEDVHFTTVHMPLVRTPMIAPTRLYDRFPAISPEQAAELIARAIRTRPKTVNTRLGTLGEVSYALSPTLVDRVLSVAYGLFPDSAAARGQRDGSERTSAAQALFAKLTGGVHW
jgi:NAD(P)-dependent dehydrogenase (short-subunit alcohol dehydrogenase family)